MTDSSHNKEIGRVYEFLSLINKVAYRDVFLLSNQVLSKNPFTNSFLIRYLKKDKVEKLRLSFITSQLIRYFFYSFKSYLKYLVDFIEFSLSKLRFKCNNEQLILIDIPFLISNIKKEGYFSDTCFPGLADFFKKKNLRYAYLPIFVGMRKCFKISEIFRILSENRVPTLTEYQLLKFSDLISILTFIILYPISVFKLIKSLKINNYEQNLLKSELINTLNDVTFLSFSRYLQGKRIARLPYNNLKVISWNENQVSNKNLFKGLRSKNKKIKIYGTQLLIYSKNVLNIVTDESEINFDIVPDKIIVNGPWYIPKRTNLNYDVGPSLRFSRMFDSNNPESSKMQNILVLLPYYKDEVKNILKMLNSITTWTDLLFIKPHPATELKEFQHLLPQNAFLVNGNIYELFSQAKIMISGGASGTLLEATSFGIPTIFIKNSDKLDVNPLPEAGKGIIWDDANTPQELKEKIEKFTRLLDQNPSEINKFASFYKENFFCKPTEENIVRAFDLYPEYSRKKK